MNNDLISRAALKKAIDDYATKTDPLIWQSDIEDLIDAAPAVEEVSVIEFTEPLPLVKAQKIVKVLSKEPKGKWGSWIISEIQCPNCFRYFETDYYSTEKLKKCPNCGADMKMEDK